MSIETPDTKGLSQREKIFLYLGAFAIIVPIGALLTLGAVSLWRGDVQIAISYAQFIGGIGTIGLVLLTGWYAYQTRRMADQQWRTHINEIEHERERRQKDVNALRQALREEIETIRYLDQLSSDYSPGYSRIETIVPKEVYRANGSSLGLLTEREIELVVEYYTRAIEVENLMLVQKEEDTTSNVNRIMEIFYISDLIVDKLLKITTFGRHTPSREKRADEIRRRLEHLAETQEEAIAELEKHLQNNR